MKETDRKQLADCFDDSLALSETLQIYQDLFDEKFDINDDSTIISASLTFVENQTHFRSIFPDDGAKVKKCEEKCSAIFGQLFTSTISAIDVCADSYPGRDRSKVEECGRQLAISRTEQRIHSDQTLEYLEWEWLVPQG